MLGKKKEQLSVEQIEAQASQELQPTMPHYHKNEEGVLIQCYHSCRKSLKDTLGNTAFWIGITVSYPLEHFLYEHVWPFSTLTHLIGH